MMRSGLALLLAAASPQTTLAITTISLNTQHPATPKVHTTENPLAKCHHQFSISPNRWESSRCFFEKGLQSPNTKKQAIQTLDQLLIQFPNHPFLMIARAHFDWSKRPNRALARYNASVHAAVTTQNTTAELVARTSRLKLLTLQKNKKAVAHELAAIQHISTTTSNQLTKARAQMALLHHDMRRAKNLDPIFQQIRTIDRQIGNQAPYSLQKQILLELGHTGMKLGRWDQAENSYRRLFQLASTQQDPLTRINAQYNLSNLDLLRLSWQSNAERRKHLEMQLLEVVSQSEAIGRPITLLQTLESLGRILAQDKSRHPEAIAHLERCLSLAKGKTLSQYAGMCHAVLSQVRAERSPSMARQHVRMAAELLKDSEQIERKVYLWRQLMRRSWDSLEKKEALWTAMVALEVIELFRKSQSDPIGQQEIFANWTLDYEWLSHRLFQQAQRDPNFLAIAFSIVERGRARVLLDRIQSKNITDSDARQNEPRTRNQPRLDRLDRLDQLANLHIRLLEEDLTSTKRKTILQKIKTLANVANNSSQLYFSSDLAMLSEVQNALRADEAMVMYQVGPQTGIDGEEIGGAWALVMTSSKVQSVKIDGDRTSAQHALRLYRGLIVRRDGSEGDASDRLHRRWFGPILETLPSHIHSIVIVADGPLHHLPIATLSTKSQRNAQWPFQVSRAPSATIWLNWRKSMHSTSLRSPSVLALINPELSNPHSSTPDQSSLNQLDRGTPIYPSERTLPPLPATKREGQAILRHMAKGSRMLMASEASEHALFQTWDSSFGALHLGAHSLVNIEDPERSAILLAPNKNQFAHNDVRYDGQLQVQEILQLDFRNAVVILGGCATAYGTTLAGEGVLSLTQAFQAAGAIAVVASLWPVRDDEAADLFQSFYAHLGAGKSLSRALQQAQFELRRSGAAAQSYSGFAVFGDGQVRLADQSKMNTVPTESSNEPSKETSSFLQWIILFVATTIGLTIEKPSEN